jgi:hypothetical protein
MSATSTDPNKNKKSHQQGRLKSFFTKKFTFQSISEGTGTEILTDVNTDATTKTKKSKLVKGGSFKNNNNNNEESDSDEDMIGEESVSWFGSKKYDSEKDASPVVRSFLATYLRKKRFRLYVQKDPALKDARLRIATINEIIATERSFVSLLNKCVKKYMEPLSSKKLLDEQQIAIIFSNMEQIKAANETLLAGMEDGTMTMGQLFKRMGPFFKIYSEYVKNFDQSSALLDELALKNKKIARFLETTSDNPDVGMALASFLILPVQRIPRYKLLLSELIKRTPEDHIDYANLTAAEKEVAKVANEVNEKKRKDEADNAIIALQSVLSSRINDILRPHRSFVSKGVLCVNNSDTRYDAYMYNDVLFLIPPKVDAENIIVLFFVFCEVVEQDANEFTITLRILSNNNIQSFVLKCLSYNEFITWSEDITSNISAIHQKILKKFNLNNIQPLFKIGNSRKTLLKELEEAEQSQDSIKTELEQLQPKYLALQAEICYLEDEIRFIRNKLLEKRLEFEEMKKSYDPVFAKKNDIDIVLTRNSHLLKECDYVILRMLNNDDDAFKEIFNDKAKVQLLPDAAEESTILSKKLALLVPNEYTETDEPMIETLNLLYRKPLPDHWRYLPRERFVPKYLPDREYYSKYEMFTSVQQILEPPSEEIYDNEQEEEEVPVLSTPLDILPKDVKDVITYLQSQSEYWKRKYISFVTNE